MAQIRQVVSESLQATVRRLLPSQQGFTEDLQASNVITPIIDLTPSAEGDQLPVDLARAIAFGSQTAFNVFATTTTIINNTGFYRIFGMSNVSCNAGNQSCYFQMTNGLTTKTIWAHAFAAATEAQTAVQYDFIVFLASGESITATTASSNSTLTGSTRQIADVNGNRVNPDGFSFS